MVKDFVKLPLEIYQPNAQLEDLEIDYEKDYRIEELKVRHNLVGMYKGDMESTEVWIGGNDQAHTVMLSEAEFEMRLAQAMTEDI